MLEIVIEMSGVWQAPANSFFVFYLSFSIMLRLHWASIAVVSWSKGTAAVGKRKKLNINDLHNESQSTAHKRKKGPSSEQKFIETHSDRYEVQDNGRILTKAASAKK